MRCGAEQAQHITPTQPTRWTAIDWEQMKKNKIPTTTTSLIPELYIFALAHHHPGRNGRALINTKTL